MTAKLYIAGYDVRDPIFGVDTGYDHSYIFYDPDTDGDSNPSTGTNVKIIRGGPDSNYSGVASSNIIVELRSDAHDSFDYHLDTQTLAQQDFRELLSGSAATNAFNAMWNFALTLGNSIPGQNGLYESGIDYDLLGPNSNSVTNTILNVAGINFRTHTPYADGSTTTYHAPSEYPGHMALTDGNGDSTYTAYIYNTDATFFHKRGGNDRIVLEWNNFTNEHAQLIVDNSAQSTGLTTVYMDGLNFANVVFTQSGNDLSVSKGGNELVHVEDYYVNHSNPSSDGSETTAFEFQDLVYRLGDASDNFLDSSTVTKNARLDGGGGNDTLWGGSGNDILIGGDGIDILDGGAGNDRFYITGTGTDTIYGGTGADTLDMSSYTAGLFIPYGAVQTAGPSPVTLVTFGTTNSDVETILLGSGNDTVSYPMGLTIDGGAGHDSILLAVSLTNPWTVGANFASYGPNTYSNFEKFVVDTNVNIMITALGHEYGFGTSVQGKLNYSQYAGPLTFSSSGTTVTASNGSATDTITAPSTGFTCIGSNAGDTINGSMSFVNSFWLGTGNDVVNRGSNPNISTFVYTGGTDVVDNINNLTLKFAPGIQATNITLMDVNVTNLSYESNNIRTYNCDIKVVVAGLGSILLEGAYKRVDSVNGIFGDANDQYLVGTHIPSIILPSGQINYAPIAFDDNLSANQITGNVLSNNGNGADFDPNGDPLSVMAGTFSTAQGGSVELSANGDFSYMPANGFSGTDSFTYTIADGRGGVDTGLVTVMITATALNGTASNDTLIGTSGNDLMLGYAGDDIIEGKAGDDIIDGGSGIDTASYASAASGVTVSLAVTTAQNTIGAGTDTLSGIENLRGSAFNDTLTGDAGNNVIEGGAGNDSMNGSAGTDTLSYEHASSAVTFNLALVSAQVTGGAGTDTAAGFENLTGSAFNDTLTGNIGNNVIEGGAGDDAMDGGGGIDTASYASAVSSVIVDLAIVPAEHLPDPGGNFLMGFGGFSMASSSSGGGGPIIIPDPDPSGAQNTGGAGIDTLRNFENLTGSAFGDVLSGNSGANLIDGGAGNDTIQGRGGNDTLIGGLGTDTVSYEEAGAVTVNLSLTTAQNTFGAGTDTLSGFENLKGSAFNDTLTGDGGNNTLYGSSGNDTIDGGAGNDILHGDGGNDTIKGGLGTDALYGDAGVDSFIFEAASAFAAQDTVADFSTSQGDKLNISNLLIGYNPAQSAIDDFVTFTTSGGNTVMAVDRDGTGSAYGFQNVATLNGVTGLDADTLRNNGNLVA